MIYFISDSHFYHFNILKLNPLVRKFGFEIEILENLKNTLREGDTLYHLGDFTWQLYDKMRVLERWKKLRARKVLVMGNHDHRFGREVLKEFFDEVYDPFHILEVDGLRILLSHYPALDLKTDRFPEMQGMVEKKFFEEGCDVLVHGHVHYNPSGPMCGCYLKGIPCLNVNVELWDFKPVSLKEVMSSVLDVRLQGKETPQYRAP